MTPTERRLFTDLLGALAERFTDQGHIKAQVENEHRGSCPVRTGCGLRCSTYQRLMIETTELLEAEMAVETPAQVSMFGEAAV